MEEDWSEEELELLDAAKIPQEARSWFVLFGTHPACVACAVENTAVASGLWPELTITPTRYELRVWRMAIISMAMHGQQVHIHPSAMPGPYERPEGAPALEVTIDAKDNADHMGIRLAIAFWEWVLLERRREAEA